jgi:hypothetical protein
LRSACFFLHLLALEHGIRKKSDQRLVVPTKTNSLIESLEYGRDAFHRYFND